MKNKIGVGLLTYNRPEYYKRVLFSIPKHKIEHLVVVNDGNFSYAQEGDADKVILTKKQAGVSVCKNLLLKELLKRGCTNIFLIEDDNLIIHPDVFEVYINTANYYGVHHLAYERLTRTEDTVKASYKDPNSEYGLDFFHNAEAGFTYIHADLINKYGFFDENYFNAFEHVDFTYNLVKNKVAPPFWYFPDVLNSNYYVLEIPNSLNNSSITNKPGYNENVEKGAKHFINKWDIFTNQIPQVSVQELKTSLKYLKSAYQIK
jgi:GT2 family glycosyltransferase